MTILGAGQADFHVADLRYNLDLLRRLLDEAAVKQVDILVLPELASSGYVFADAAEARASSEEIPGGQVCELLAEWSQPGRMAVCGICERAGDRVYNSAAVFAGGGHAATYRKAHLFLNEKTIFTPGDAEPPVIDFQGWRVGVMICFDWAFPEMARLLALGGAQVILHPSNLVLPYAQSAMLTRGLENGVFTVTANRHGQERGTPFSGRSQVTSPKGALLAQAAGDFTGVLTAVVDLAQADDKQITPLNHVLNDRRPDLYRRLVEG